MHLPDSPAWKSKQRKKKKVLQEQQEKYGPTMRRSQSEPAQRQPMHASPANSSSGQKAKFFARKPSAAVQLQPGDDLFAAMVIRQARLRKRAAGLQHRRFEEPPRLNSKGEIVEVREEDYEARQQTHQECAAEIISELAFSAKRRSQSQTLSQDLKFTDRNWTQSMTKRDMGSRNRNSAQRDSIDAAELCLSPWEALVHRHRRYRKLAEAAAAAEAAGENTDPGPAALEQEHSASDSEASSESMEEPKVQPSVPSWDCPSNSKEQQPPPPPMPPHWQEFHDRKKEHEKMEKEKELRRERREREAERRAVKEGRQDKIKQEYAWQDGQKKRKRRGQTASESPSGPPETNTSDSEIEPSSSAWRPWHCFFPRRHRSKVKLPGRAGRWGRGWRWGSAKVAPECSSKPDDDGEPTAQEGNCLGGAATVNLPGDNLVLEIDEELDRARDLPQQERKKIFRELQRRIHPDKNLADPDAAKLAFQYLMDNRTSFLRS